MSTCRFGEKGKNAEVVRIWRSKVTCLYNQGLDDMAQNVIDIKMLISVDNYYKCHIIDVKLKDRFLLLREGCGF